MSAHTYLSPSGAHRWLNCTSSPRLSEGYTDTGSEAAREGTLAHELGEIYLLAETDRLSSSDTANALARIQAHPLYSADMPRFVSMYSSLVLTELDGLREAGLNPRLDVELKVSIDKYVTGGKGISDAVITAGPILKLIDLKFGRGQVDAQDNPQLKLYALGVIEHYSMLHDFLFVELIIVQPRLGHVSRVSYSVAELVKWGEDYVKPRATAALNGGSGAVAGEWCTFCPARFDCAVRAEAALAEAQEHFTDEKPELLDTAALTKAYSSVKIFDGWIKDAEKALHKRLLNGETVPGYKLVTGRSNRRWADEAAAIKVFRALKLKKSDYINEKIIGITEATNLLGVDGLKDAMGDLIHRPEGAPVLAPDTDERPLYGLAKALSAFTVEPE